MGTGNIEILPLEVVAQAFPARPSALPDVRDFVRKQVTMSDDDVRVLCERVADVLLDGAGAVGTIQVSLRITPALAEVDVIFAPDVYSAPAAAERAVDQRPRPAAPPPGPATRADEAHPNFAAWLAARLRGEGLTMESAARRLEVSTKTISRWVAGTTEPRLRDLYRIRETFGEPFH